MKPQILNAVQKAFNAVSVQDQLEERGGRVFGSIIVIGSATFDGMDRIRRQRHLWAYLRDSLGADSTQVGPILLKGEVKDKATA